MKTATEIYEAAPSCHSGHRYIRSIEWIAEVQRDAQLERGNILGRIACELFPGHDNVTDEQCLMGVKALTLELANLKRAGEQFDADLVELLSQCQEGRMTCIYAAQVIEGKMQERLRQTEAERDEALKKVAELEARNA